MLIEAKELTKTYPSRDKKDKLFYAVQYASFSIDRGETISLLGESGGGKSTAGQMLAGLLKPDDGTFWYGNKKLSYPFRGDVRRKIQILFQHPEVSFNPMLPLEKSMVEPYQIYRKPYSREILLADIERFGLHEEHMKRLPAELSGGELQRAALARILTVEPEFIVLDEPTSMLDVISQAQILHMLRDYQKTSGCAYLFITHNVALAHMFGKRVYRMNSGVCTQEMAQNQAAQ